MESTTLTYQAILVLESVPIVQLLNDHHSPLFSLGIDMRKRFLFVGTCTFHLLSYGIRDCDLKTSRYLSLVMSFVRLFSPLQPILFSEPKPKYVFVHVYTVRRSRLLPTPLWKDRESSYRTLRLSVYHSVETTDIVPLKKQPFCFLRWYLQMHFSKKLNKPSKCPFRTFQNVTDT